MIKSPRLKVSLGATALVSLLGATAHAGTFTGYPNDVKQTVTTYGGDFKLRVDTHANAKCWAALDATEKTTLISWVNELDLDVIRIPIYAVAYPSSGNYSDSAYNNVRDLMTRLKNVDSSLAFFASPTESGPEHGWPDWLDGVTGSQNGAAIDPTKYNDWINRSMNSLSQNYTVQYLGPFNEDGQIPESIKWRVYNNFPGKTRVGACSWNLATSDDQLNTVVSGTNKLVNYVNITSAHAYDFGENYFAAYHQDWINVKNTAPSKPLWASEATGWGLGIDAGAAYYFNAMKGNVDGIIQYQILGQIIKFASGSAVDLAPRDGTYYAFKGIKNRSKGLSRVGSTLSSMPDSRGVVFKMSNTKYAMMVARPNGVSHTYSLSGKVITSVKRFEFNTTTTSDPTGTNVTVNAGGASFTNTSSAPLVIYEVTVQ